MKMGLSLFLTVWLTVSTTPSLFQTVPSYLAPKVEWFHLNAVQKKQAQNFIRTLAQIESLWPREGPGFALQNAEGFLYHRLDPTIKIETIPRLELYRFLGKENVSCLRQILVQAVTGTGVLPKKLAWQIRPAAGLYPFLKLIQTLKKEELSIFDSIEIRSFHRDLQDLSHLNKPLLYLTGMDLTEGLAAFRVYGNEAKKISEALFQKENYAAAQLKEELLKRTPAAKDLCAALSALAKAISSGQELNEPLRNLFLKAGAYTKTFSYFPIIRSINEQLQNPDKEEALLLQQKIKEHFIALDQKNGEIDYLNLPALVGNQGGSFSVLAGVSHVVLNMEALLALPQNPEKQIVWEILLHLTDPEKPMAGPEAADRSKLFTAFSKEIFEDSSVLYALLQILAKTTQIPPFYKNNSQKDYREIIQQNILTALQRARPNWFQASLAFLDDEATFDGIVSFLAATGWVDMAIQMELQTQRTSLPDLKKIKALLQNKIVATAQTVSNGQLPQEGPLFLFNRIKNHLFFATQSFDETTLPLLFLPSETWLDLAQKNKGLDSFSQALAQELGLKKTTSQIHGFFFYCFNEQAKYYKEPLDGLLYAAHSFFDAIKKVLPNAPDGVTEFESLIKIMQLSSLTKPQIQQFLRSFFYYYIEEKVKKELDLLFIYHLIPQCQPTVDTRWMQELWKKLKEKSAISFALISLNLLIQSNSTDLDSLKTLFSDLLHCGQIKNAPNALLKKLEAQDKRLAYFLGVELLREIAVEAKIVETQIPKFPKLEAWLNSFFNRYQTVEEAMKAIDEFEEEALLNICPLIKPTHFVAHYSALFSLSQEERQSIIPALAKRLSYERLLLAANHITDDLILPRLRDLFRQEQPITWLFQQAQTYIKKAPPLLLEEFSDSMYLKEIQEKLNLNQWLNETAPSYSELLKEHRQTDPTEGERNTILNLLPFIDMLQQLIHNPIPEQKKLSDLLHPSLVASYETQIKKLLAEPPAGVLEKSL